MMMMIMMMMIMMMMIMMMIIFSRLHSEDSLFPHMTTDTHFKIKENTLEM